METAGKQVDDDELRELMKENGIGRPSTRANIIETISRRKYIKKEKKRLVATVAGMQLIDTIQNELLKSAELTGMWEKKLRDIEQGNYEVDQFMIELKQMVFNIVKDVKSRVDVKKIAAIEDVKEKEISKKKTPANAKDLSCPKCKEGQILKGKASWGCSNWKNGCDIRLPFDFQGKKLTDKQIEALILKQKTPKIKGFEFEGKKQNGIVILDPSFDYSFVAEESEVWHCPLCKDGTMMKGNSAFGCSNYKQGCRFIIPFEFMGKSLTEAQIKSLVVDRKTKLIKGFVNPENQEKVDGKLIVDNMGKIVFGKQ